MLEEAVNLTQKSKNKLQVEVEVGGYRGSSFSVGTTASLDGFETINLSPTLQNKVKKTSLSLLFYHIMLCSIIFEMVYIVMLNCMKGS